MRSWQKLGIEDTFIFDYHNAGAGLLDGLGADVGAITARDMRDLQDLGIGGMMSCQVVRGFLPTPYLMNVMADVLWNRKLAVKPHRQAVMEAAFGKHAAEVETYLATLVKMTRAEGKYGHKLVTDQGVGTPEQLAELVSFTTDRAARFAKLAQEMKSEVRRTSFDIIAVHAEHLRALARVRLAGANKRSCGGAGRAGGVRGGVAREAGAHRALDRSRRGGNRERRV